MSTASALSVISDDIYASRDQFDGALVDRSISFTVKAEKVQMCLGYYFNDDPERVAKSIQTVCKVSK